PQEITGVLACSQYSMDQPKVSYRRRIYVKDCDATWPPQRYEVQPVQSTDHADHVNVIAPLWDDSLIVRFERRKLAERSVLTAIIGAVKNVFRMVVVHLAVECAWRL